ncbi:MAG: hypothetical protein U0Z44_11075 [Kouleothrix sp.]
MLPDPRDRLLAHCAFAQGLRPREIVQAYRRARWNNERAVSIDLYRIRRMLRGDAELRQLLGIEPGEVNTHAKTPRSRGRWGSWPEARRSCGRNR